MRVFGHWQVMKIKLQPASATDLPAFNPILPLAAITQVMLIAHRPQVCSHITRRRHFTPFCGSVSAIFFIVFFAILPRDVVLNQYWLIHVDGGDCEVVNINFALDVVFV